MEFAEYILASEPINVFNLVAYAGQISRLNAKTSMCTFISRTQRIPKVMGARKNGWEPGTTLAR